MGSKLGSPEELLEHRSLYKSPNKTMYREPPTNRANETSANAMATIMSACCSA